MTRYGLSDGTSFLCMIPDTRTLFVSVGLSLIFFFLPIFFFFTLVFTLKHLVLEPR